MVAARGGARVALAGGAGDDEWGRWLHERLGAAGVDPSLFELVDGAPTPMAVVAIGADAEPRYRIYGEGIATVVHALRDRLEDAVHASAALFISSNTLVGAEERALTMRAREIALELGRPVIFDPNFRLHRWGIARRRRSERQRLRAGRAARARQPRRGGADDRRGRPRARRDGAAQGGCADGRDHPWARRRDAARRVPG